MQNVSERYKQVVVSPSRKFVYKAKIELNTGDTMDLDEHDIILHGLRVNQVTSLNEQLQVGNVSAARMDLQLNNFTRRFEGIDLNSAVITPYVGLIVMERWDDGELPEWTKMGVFKVESANACGRIINVMAFDRMFEFDRPYKESKLTYPATLRQILEDCCIGCGVPLVTHDFTNADYIVSVRPDDEAATYRDVLGWVAELAGCYAQITVDGALKLDWYDFDHPVADIRDVKDLWAQDVQVTGVQLRSKPDGENIVYGDTGYVIDLSKNPLTQDNILEYGKALARKLKKTAFRPFTHEGLSNPALEAGDAVTIYDRDGNAHKSIISSLTYKSGSTETYRGDAETPASKQSTRYGIVDVIVAAAKNDTKRQISAYDTEAKRFASLAAASVGGYPSQEVLDDGSVIYYYHDKPERSESRYIRKVSGEGTFISSDGGKTWAGIDKNANALLNNLSVRTINADMIRAGRIEAQTGGAYFDLDRGEIAATRMISSQYPQFVANIGPSERGEEGAWNLYDSKDCLMSVYKVHDADGNPGTVWTAPWLNNSVGTNRKGVAISKDSISVFADKDGWPLGLKVDNKTGQIKLTGSLVVSSPDSKGDYYEVLSTTGSSIDAGCDLNMHHWRILNTSDERLKTNIVDYSGDALEVVNGIALKSYDWRKSGEHQTIGYIAQQLEQIEPDLVTKTIDGTYAVKPLELIPYLVGAVQQLKAEVEELRENK